MTSFSIIVATYNSGATVRDTLESIQRQRIAELEVILQDGGSSDDTLEIAAEYDFVKIVSAPDSGLYNAMNAGIKRATGDIVGILNSDDFYASADVLQKVRQKFADDDELDAVYGSLNFVDHRDTTQIKRIWNTKKYDYAAWRKGWMPPHPTFFVRKSVYERFGGFNETLKIGADYEFMLRCCYVNRINVGHIPQTLVHMRTGGVSNNSLKNRLRVVYECTRAWPINGLRAPLLFPLMKPLRKINQWTKTL